MSDLADIIERLEKAPGPDPLLDGDIGWAVNEWINEGGFWRRHKVTGARERFTYCGWPLYTHSIDAALTLVPEGWEWSLSYEAGKYCCEAGDPLIGLCSEAPIPAIALCIAALRARMVTDNLAHREQS
jgi:hypothetical protein